MKLSATIITFNEESNIAKAIKSLNFVDEIIVVDSMSSDNTVKIAQDLGAKVITHKFLGFGQQKNLAAEHAKGEWILNIDADEEVDDDLKASILNVVQGTPDVVIFKVIRKTFFCNKFIRFGGWYPNIIGRLYKKNAALWSGPHVHEDLFPLNPNDKNFKVLNGHLNHYSFKSVRSQVQTNIKYATLGAKELIKRKNKRPFFVELFFRPIGKFIECYFIKLGMLDGAHGLIIAINASYSMFMKYSFSYFDYEQLKE